MSEPTHSLKNFRAFELSVVFYKECKKLKLPYSLQDQLMRAASSISLNLMEGSAKPSKKDRARFYGYSLASLREVQAIIRLEDLTCLSANADHLAAMLYKLTHY